MPKFIFDTAGAVQTPEIRWADLDAFTQGYIEAAFFTSSDEDGNAIPQGFSDLAPQTLAAMIADCARFQQGKAMCDVENAPAIVNGEPLTFPGEAQAGRDFWFTRNGHGCGFWDGDWPEPYATALADAARAFGQVDLYVGDDGKVYL